LRIRNNPQKKRKEKGKARGKVKDYEAEGLLVKRILVKNSSPRAEGRSDEGARIKMRLGKKVDGKMSVLEKGGIRRSDELLFNLEKLQGSTDEESLDILEKMKRKNEKRLRRMREIEQDKLMFA